MDNSNTPQQPVEASSSNFCLTKRQAIIFCLVVGFVYICTLKNGCESWNIDSFYYLSLAKSLASFEGYKILDTPHTKYPFGFPCLLAPIVGVFGYNFLVIQVFLVIIALIALYVTFVFLRQFSKEGIAGVAFLLTGASYFFWGFSCNYIVSETPYLLFSLLTLIIAQKSIREDYNVIRNSILLSLLILASYFIRMVGIALLLAVCLVELKPLIKGRKSALRRLCVTLLICAVAMTAWYVRGKMYADLGGAEDYVQEFALRAKEAGQPRPIYVASVIKRNLVNNTTHIAAFVTSIPKFPNNLRFWGCLISLLFILGFLYCFIKRRTVVEWYMAFYIGIHLVWPYDYVRFWYPVIPLVFYYLLKALSLIRENLVINGINSRRRMPMFFALLFSGVFLAYVPLSETQYYQDGLMGYYQMLVSLVFVILYFLMASISFIFAFFPERTVPFTGNGFAAVLSHPSLCKIVFAIIVFHNVSMIAYRTYLKHQDYGLRNVGLLYFQEMGQWLRQHSDDNAVVMCDNPVAHSVYSERACIYLPEPLSPQGIVDAVKKENARYVIVENNKNTALKNPEEMERLLKYLRRVELMSMFNFKKVLDVEGNLLFKIKPRPPRKTLKTRRFLGEGGLSAIP